MNETCSLEFRGVHNNPYPPLGSDIEYMEHSHIFGVECGRVLRPSHRAWSAYNFREEVEEFLHGHFTDHKAGGYKLGVESCISLAELLVSRLGLSYCKVTEDGVAGIELIVAVLDFDLEKEHNSKIGE